MALILLTACSVWPGGCREIVGRGRCAPRLVRPATMRISAADEQRLLYSEKALNAFICAEMRHFCESKMAELAEDETPELKGRRDARLEELFGSGEAAVDLICSTTGLAFRELHHSDASVLSALGSAITYLHQYFRTDELASPLQRVGITDYEAAHHMTDMYMSRRDVGVGFARIMQPSGMGMIAAREGVGLPPADAEIDYSEDENECLVWSPTREGECIHWKSEIDQGFRQRRFDRVQMEGTRDPRRGGSGTAR